MKKPTTIFTDKDLVLTEAVRNTTWSKCAKHVDVCVRFEQNLVS